MRMLVFLAAVAVCMLLFITSCAAPPVGAALPRRGTEIVIGGQLFNINSPVVLWTDPGGYDAYRTEKRFVPLEESAWGKGGEKGLESPNRFSTRKGLTPEEAELVRGGGWTLPQLQETIDQFVIHYDVCGTSRTCFRVLHDQRGLSVHFMLDVDGTIYQTLDVKERAWHATICNDRSVGIEIAHIGAYPLAGKNPLADWYHSDAAGTHLTIPRRLDGGGVRTPEFAGSPARPHAVVGRIQGQELQMYDYTPQQYAALIKLTAALHMVLPKIQLDAPREADGAVMMHQLTPEQLASFQGVLGHFHIQKEKIDPGPAFDWERVLRGARREAARRETQD